MNKVWVGVGWLVAWLVGWLVACLLACLVLVGVGWCWFNCWLVLVGVCLVLVIWDLWMSCFFWSILAKG